MEAAGVFKPYKEGAYLGSEIKRVEAEYSTLYTLFEVCKDIDIPKDKRDIDFALQQAKEKSAIVRLKALGENGGLPGWIMDKGKPGMEPLYVVRERHYDKYLHFLNTWELQE